VWGKVVSYKLVGVFEGVLHIHMHASSLSAKGLSYKERCLHEGVFWLLGGSRGVFVQGYFFLHFIFNVIGQGKMLGPCKTKLEVCPQMGLSKWDKFFVQVGQIFFSK